MSSPAPAADPRPSPTPSNPPLPTKPPPPGFKWVRARKPDGTFITAKKRLTPEELEAQKKAEAANPTPTVPKTDTPNTNGTPAEPTTPDAAVRYKIITARKPDGTLVKVKRPLKPGETVNNTTTKPAVAAPPTAAPASSDSDTATKKETLSPDTPTAAPEPELSSADKELLREQALANKKHRRGRFGTALLVGLLGVAGSTLPDLMDGDEIMSDSDMDLSDDDYDDDHDDHDDPDDDRHDAENQKAGSNEPSSAPNLVPVAAGVATAAVGAVAVAALTAPPPARTANRQLNSDAQQPDDQNGADEKGKAGYRVTVKDLNDLDEKAERDAAERPLERRWAAVSFYLLASLSIILPLLFLILTTFIMSMGNKSTESTWGKMVDPIKISVTVWPIVFAAVTAQGFKTWASYRVERGVKLMELEQLVGSNSFSAVMKQPILLRRLDLLTLGIFVIWGLSPIGSQALLRTYSLGRAFENNTVPVLYVPIRGENMLLSPGAMDKIENTVLAELWQTLSTYYIGAFMSPSPSRYATGKFYYQDAYNQPLPYFSSPDLGEGMMSFYGVPVALPGATLNLDADESSKAERSKEAANAETPSENIEFPITSSFFRLKCGSWKQGTRAFLDNSTFMATSMSETLGIEFFPDPTIKATDPGDENLPVTGLRYATLNPGQKVLDRTESGQEIKPHNDWKYTYIDCDFHQVFYTATAKCSINSKTGGYAFNCDAEDPVLLPPDQVKPEWRTVLRDFSYELTRGGNSYPVLDPYTTTEKFVANYGMAEEVSESAPDHSTQTPENFEYLFGALFNTFIHLAHCVECVTISSLSLINATLAGIEIQVNPEKPKRVTTLYVPPTTVDGKAKHSVTLPGFVFKLDWRWVSVLLASVIVLLIIGIASIVLESFLIAPDVLGYASSLARNNRYLHLPKTAAKPMSGPERARTLGGVSVMIQDVKPDKSVGKIALGLHHDRAEKLKPGRLYR